MKENLSQLFPLVTVHFFWQIFATSLLGIIAVRVTADTKGKFV